MKGFSLIEVLVSLALGLVIMAGVVKFSMHARNSFAFARARLETQANLSMTHAALQELFRPVEAEFWERFPPREELFHPAEHSHHGFQFTRSSPEGSPGGCLLFWDIRPKEEVPLVYQVDDDLGFPQYLQISPFDLSHPAGPGPAIGPMSVLLFSGASTAACLLVERVDGGTVFLAAEAAQPWALPAGFEPLGMEVLHLGALEVTHIGLQPEPERNHKLVLQSWQMDGGSWQPKPRVTSYTHLHSLNWIPCGEGRPDRLVILAQSPRAGALSRPLEILGESFEREVSCASLEL